VAPIRLVKLFWHGDADTLFSNIHVVATFVMRFKHVVFIAFLCVCPAVLVSGQDPDVSPRQGEGESCAECGVIYDIQGITTESPAARTMQPEGAPVGPFLNIPLTRKPGVDPEIGAYGSRKWRKEFEVTRYEVIVRFDDGRYTLIEMDDASALRIGQRVRVRQKRVEPLGP